MENKQQNIDTTSEYVLIKDGNGMEIKHINFNNPNICPRQGIIEIEAMKKVDSERSVSNNASFAKFEDKRTGIVWGIPMTIHNFSKQITYKRMKLGNNVFFDRTIPEQAEMCCVLLKALELGKFKDTNGRPRFKVRDKEKDAMKEIDLRTWKRKAADIIDSIPYGDELKDIARNMGINPDIFSPLVLANEVSKAVELKPKEFLDMYNSPTRAFLSILTNAQSMGIIEFNPMEGYKYSGMILGKTSDLAVTYLSKHPDLAQSIATFTADKRTKGKEASIPVVKLPTAVDPEKEELLRQLAEMKAKLADKNLSTPTVEKIASEGDLEALRAEAKALGVSGWQVKKISYATLKAKVDAKKQADLQAV